MSIFSNIRWGRVIVAAVLSEVGVVAMLLAAIAVYKLMISPGLSDGNIRASVNASATTSRRPPAS